MTGVALGVWIYLYKHWHKQINMYSLSG
jgi:hypothetical protein